MTYPHEAGQIGDALAFGENLGSHAIALTLVDPSALTYGDTRSILSPLLEALEASNDIFRCLSSPPQERMASSDFPQLGQGD